MKIFKKIALIIATTAVMAAAAVAVVKYGGEEKTVSVADNGLKGTSTPVPLAKVDNESFMQKLWDAGAESTEIKSMAATRTPIPTVTPIPWVTRLTASYKGKELVVGDTVDRQDIEVRGVFYNGSVYTTDNVTKFEILNPVIYEVGDNIITIWYDGCEAEIRVKGREPLEVVKITANYKGQSVIVSNRINKDDVEVYAHYNWREKEPDKVTNFTLEPDVIEAVGSNTIYVHYGEVDPVAIRVNGLEKKITAVEAKYIGEAVYVGEYVDESDIEIVVTYNDGSEGTAENFTMTADRINSEGVNYVIINYKGYTMKVEVQGIVKASKIWDDFPDFSWGGYASTFVTLLVSREKRAQTIGVTYVDWHDIDACVNRVFYTKNYLGFEVGYTDPDAIFEFPMPCRVRVPDGFDRDNFSIYYSPNKKTIMARINGEFLSNSNEYYVFMLEEPGTYIMMDIESGKLVSSINVKETNLRMRVNRNYSIDPVIMPETAGNKEVTYSSTDESVATVSDKGKIKTIAPGECDIYIRATDESGVYEKIHLTVTKK